MSFGKGNQSPVRREDLLSDPVSLPQMRELIGYILVLSWDCHFLSLWPGHLMVDSYRNQGAEEQTWMLETRRLGPRLRSGSRAKRAMGLGPPALLRSAPLRLPAYEGGLEKSSADLRPRPRLNTGGHQHKVSEQMTLHDVITIWCAAREGECNINGTFLLKDKSRMM